jgi:hypothetical protein
MDTLNVPKTSYAETKMLLIFLLGIFLGSLVTWKLSYGTKDLGEKSSVPSLRSVFKHSDTKIAKENFHCDLEAETVGDVIATILAAEMPNVRNQLSYSCHSNAEGVQECAFGTSDCTPWRDRECSSLSLAFSLDKKISELFQAPCPVCKYRELPGID